MTTITIGGLSILLTFFGFLFVWIIIGISLTCIFLDKFRMEDDDAKQIGMLIGMGCSMFTIYWTWKGIFWMLPDVRNFI